MAAIADTGDPRFERVFEFVPREAFLPPGPWHIMPSHIMRKRRYVETPSADPIHLYQNALVAIDAAKGIHNGEPFLHAAWLGAVAPKPGEVICHIGAGTGYYTALLSMLALPAGQVHAFEIEGDLARRARDNLQPFAGVSVTTGDATKLPLPPCDLIYVNAGVVAPPSSWLRALRPGGRMIFPWRPADDVGLTVILHRSADAFEVMPLMPAWFIPCIGASSTEACTRAPDGREARAARSAWLVADKEPDDTAVAAYEHMWFSSAPV
jgi:protein-L-isoaspartate(D-aspartate) O-methyltransferase